MAFVRYNETLDRVGFRPQGTNPRAAAALSGPIRHGYETFGPWVLHGEHLLPRQIFSERGGEMLHGMGDLGAMVPDQSIVVYQGKWQSTYTMGATDVIAAVSAALQSDGAVTVRNASSDAGVAQSTIVGMTIQPGPFNVTLQLQVTNGQGFGSPSDIASIVAHYVYQVTGSMPLTSSIPSVQAPGGGPAGTGQPGAIDPTTGLPYSYHSAGAQDWSSWLQDNFGTVALLAGALFVLPPLVKRIF